MASFKRCIEWATSEPFSKTKKRQQNNVIKKHLLKRLLGLKQFNLNNFHLHKILYKFFVDKWK